jgi:phage-related protein/predicted XRE-type DNA-binding protein
VPAPDKTLVILSGEIKTPPLSKQARIDAGVLLRRLQRGEVLSMPQSRPMPVVGPRCHELRIPDPATSQTWRILYRTDPWEILVVDVFSKKTQQTPRQVIDTYANGMRNRSQAMDARKRAKLKKLGGRVTTVRKFLGLDDAETAVVELRIELAAAVRERRMAAGLTQAQLAKALGSSQSRVAKLEGADSQASIESMVRALAVAGARIKLRVA